MNRADWVISSKITSKGQVTLPKVVRTKLGIREGDLIGFTIEKNHRVYIEKMNQGVLCPICEGDSLKKGANKLECVICNNQGLLYQSNEGEWLLLAAKVAQLFTLQLNLYKTNQQYRVLFEGAKKHPQRKVIEQTQELIEKQLNQYLKIQDCRE